MQDARWIAVVPVKEPKRAKSRLGPSLEAWRTDLAAAFAADTLAALIAATRVDLVVVIGGQGLPVATLDHPRVRTLPDPGDLNAAARHGIAWARREDKASGVLVLTADLPAATGPAVDTLLTTVPPRPLYVIPDVEQIGTTGLLIAPGVDTTPAFGDASLARHRAAGAAVVDVAGVEGLRRDVDTAAQLTQAIELGVGARTQSVLREMRGRGR